MYLSVLVIVPYFLIGNTTHSSHFILVSIAEIFDNSTLLLIQLHVHHVHTDYRWKSCKVVTRLAGIQYWYQVFTRLFPKVAILQGCHKVGDCTRLSQAC